ncbi:YkvA family protein [Pontibacter sp. 172403-2]|uniref:YkvA family protein n=1 Tax=Pontibacter rufus TaxID=2791028 RepID=UPI001E64A4C9|nr:YkvA family protein [Pontibacter sp. 172403-2]
MENQRPEGKSIADSPLFKSILNKAEKYLKHPSQIASLLNEAFKKATAKQSVGALAAEAWESLQLLSRMIKAATSGEYKGIPTTSLVGGVAVIIYFIMPLDLIPDIIPVVGLLDDATLLAWFMSSIKSELDKYKEWEATRPIPVQEPESTQPDATHNADPSFGTPKYSDTTEGAVQIQTKTDV